MATPTAIDEIRLESGLVRNVAGVHALRSCERLSAGASQETYRLVVETSGGDRSLALRRTAGGLSLPRQPGRPGIGTEAALLAAARDAGVPEPELLWVFGPGDGLGDGFVMEWLEGETLGSRIVRDETLADVRPRLARLCGEVLARLHAIDLDATGLTSRLDPLPAAAAVERTMQRYWAFETPQPMIDYTWRWLCDHLPDAAVPLALVHGDFRNGNLMIGPEGIVAVLDWELAHAGDPMQDLGWLCTSSWRFGRADLPVGGFGTYDDLFAGYESVSGRPVDRERVTFWEVFGSFWWSVGCLEMAEAYRTGLDPTVERAAIGRRSSECQVDCVNLLIPGPVEPLEPDDGALTPDLPRVDELLSSVRTYLRDDVLSATRGRTRYLARVAANSVDIATREWTLGPRQRAREVARLRTLLGIDGDVATLRWALTEALRDGTMPLDRPGLAEYLRESVVGQVTIDQPKYSGLEIALAAH